MSLRLRIVTLAGLLVPLGTLAAHAEAVVLDAHCLCKRGDKPTVYFGKLALTSANREAMKTLIESGGVQLGKQVTLKGMGCNPGTFPDGWKDRCGDTSVTTWVTPTKAEWSSVPNDEYAGEVTIRITSNSGIPLALESSDEKVLLDENRWPDASVFSVMGPDVRTETAATAKRKR
ncbi:MAG: hypothetical protein AB7E80_05670 [Hyphomicrobiaceae bacterium]